MQYNIIYGDTVSIIITGGLRMKIKRRIIEINEKLCNGCGQCVLACAEGAIELINGKARLVAENYCDGLAACVGECPEGALKIVEREAEDFDINAVEDYLKSKKIVKTSTSGDNIKVQPNGCSSTGVQIFSSPCEVINKPSLLTNSVSSLMHWPVQIKLVPPNAAFLKDSELLIAADCTPIAYPAFHNDFLKGKVVLIGCPKFDDTEEYLAKFTEIFKNTDIKNLTILIMEVPCCSKLPAIISQAVTASGKTISAEVVVVSIKGEVLKKESL